MISNRIKTILLLTLCFQSFNIIIQANENHSQEQWQQWKKNYDHNLTKKEGWLSLAGLYWLSEGSNTLGSAKDNMHRLPEQAPSNIGRIDIDGQTVTFVTDNQSVRVNNKYQHKTLLSVKDRTKVSFGNYIFHIIKREKGYAVRLVDTESEIAKNFAGTDFIAFTESWILKAKLITHKVPQTMKIPTVYGTVRENESAGWLEFDVNGQQQRLQAVNYGKNTPMYVMFSDLSSGDSTYGAGRYVEVEWPDENGNTVIDFNRAYNPPCAFTSFATCPLTPKQNRLKILIKAGELYGH